MFPSSPSLRPKLAGLRRRGSSAAFTLIEIMIVVLIIGVLLSIAVPNFVKTRETTRKQGCIENLHKIQGAKEMWAMDNNEPPTASVASTNLVPEYLRLMPQCPSGGAYTVGAVNVKPTCARGGEHQIN
jgi:prepilin-type N-terminal cleavage/methylation domain-containing protein